MRRRLPQALLLALLVLCVGALSACGGDDSGPALEGEPLELGSLTYNVQITRFLNPANLEDATYLEGQPPAPDGTEYLAVFLRVDNDSDVTQTLPDSFEIVDTRDEHFDAIESDSPFALEFGAAIPADGTYPPLDTPARSGPIKGSMLLFALPDTATENRPLELRIPGPDGETGTVQLDL
jgi:hypothetical protein